MKKILLVIFCSVAFINVAKCDAKQYKILHDVQTKSYVSGNQDIVEYKTNVFSWETYDGTEKGWVVCSQEISDKEFMEKKFKWDKLQWFYGGQWFYWKILLV